jgi:hypothetical protein
MPSYKNKRSVVTEKIKNRKEKQSIIKIGDRYAC